MGPRTVQGEAIIWVLGQFREKLLNICPRIVQ